MPEPKATGIRTFAIVASVTGFLEGELDDWPNQIKDNVYLALEAKADEEQLPLTIVASRCDIDHDLPDGHPHKIFVEIIASEIVVADEREISPHLFGKKWLH